MIYVFSIIACFCLAWVYDVMEYPKGKWNWYYLLLFWFIVISGFQYMVGSDMPVYVNEYNTYYDSLRFDVGTADIEGKRQPGWVLLSFICRQITHDFILFKLIQAIFVNTAIFTFFKKESNHLFTCILIYAITSYLIINFNILRQSFAIGFILYFISSYKERKYLLSFWYLFMAFMFHNMTFVALIIPVFGIIKYKKQYAFIVIVLLVIFVYSLIKYNLTTLFESVLESNVLGDNLTGIGTVYMKGGKYNLGDATFGVARAFQTIFIICVIIYHLKKHKNFLYLGIGIMYLLFVVLNFSMPILFRFRLMFDIPFYVIFTSVIFEFPKGRLYQVRRLFYIFALTIFFYYPIREYSERYPGTPYRYIHQYYPYQSVFDDDIDRDKMRFFMWR